jgi:NADP-dependent 3-hydroxy acid dehydrogenase YdfG
MTASAPPVAVVTGATSGIGQAIALALARRGARIAVVGRSPERLRSTLDAVLEAGGQGESFAADLTDLDATSALAEQLRAWAGAVAVLVHSAGVALPAAHRTIDTGSTIDTAELQRQMAVNVRAPMLITAALLPALQAGGGTIVVLNSSAGLRSAPGDSSYAESKAALRSWTDGLRGDLSGTGVRVCSLFPGRVATPMQAALYEAHGASADYRPELLLQPADLAATVEFVLDLPAHVEITDISIRPSRRSY